jgi:hypothetical protein
MEVRKFAGFKMELVQATAAGLAAVESFLVPQLRAAVGIHNPTHRRVKYKYKKTKSGRAATHTVFLKGAPTGGPPYTRTTAGLHAIASEITDGGKTLRIGVRSNARYMLMLDAGITYPTHGGKEGGGHKMQWPWALREVKRLWPTCEQLFNTGFH